MYICESLFSYLGHGGSIRTEAWFFRIGKSTAYEIIAETSCAICNVLINKVVKLPSERQWLQTA